MCAETDLGTTLSRARESGPEAGVNITGGDTLLPHPPERRPDPEQRGHELQSAPGDRGELRRRRTRGSPGPGQGRPLRLLEAEGRMVKPTVTLDRRIFELTRAVAIAHEVPLRDLI